MLKNVPSCPGATKCVFGGLRRGCGGTSLFCPPPTVVCFVVFVYQPNVLPEAADEVELGQFLYGPVEGFFLVVGLTFIRKTPLRASFAPCSFFDRTDAIWNPVEVFRDPG